jgi:hypothetical protein
VKEVEALAGLLADARQSAVDSTAAAKIDALLSRLSGPARIALVGRANAGKSTLLNALIGERLAATDATECTRFVTAFRHADSYRVTAGGRELAFSRGEDGPLDIDVAGLDSAVDMLDVGWPSRRLEQMTLIDTPGLDALAPRGGDALEQTDFADAYLYLMRHVHRADVRFLESFVAAGAQLGSPVNSLAVLSRADEIGGGRVDGLESAHRIASRDGSDPRLRALASAVVPVVGLLAETAATLRESEARALEELARTDEKTIETLLLSVDDFRRTDLGPVTAEIRDALLHRFALFGVRTAIGAYREGRWSNGTTLARLLLDVSGLPALRELIESRFARRAQQLVARTTLRSLRAVASDGSIPAADTRRILARLEEIEVTSHSFAELALLDAVWSGETNFTAEEAAEAERVTGGATTFERVGSAQDADRDGIKAAAISAIGRWRERAADAFSDRATATAAETMARSYEGIYAEVAHAEA